MTPDVTPLRAKRIALRGLLIAERLRRQEKEAEAAYWRREDSAGVLSGTYSAFYVDPDTDDVDVATADAIGSPRIVIDDTGELKTRSGVYLSKRHYEDSIEWDAQPCERYGVPRPPDAGDVPDIPGPIIDPPTDDIDDALAEIYGRPDSRLPVLRLAALLLGLYAVTGAAAFVAATGGGVGWAVGVFTVLLAVFGLGMVAGR